MKIKLADIKQDIRTQPREFFVNSAVDDYADDMKRGVVFPPVIVFSDGTTNWLADGFHRCAAAQSAGLEEIEADVRQGSFRDAVLFSVGANHSNGVRRTSGDKRRAVIRLLSDEEWRQKSDLWIADAARVSNHFVAKVRDELFPQPKSPNPQDETGTFQFRPEIKSSREPAAPLVDEPEDDEPEEQPGVPASERFKRSLFGDDYEKTFGPQTYTGRADQREDDPEPAEPISGPKPQPGLINEPIKPDDRALEAVRVSARKRLESELFALLEKLANDYEDFERSNLLDIWVSVCKKHDLDPN